MKHICFQPLLWKENLADAFAVHLAFEFSLQVSKYFVPYCRACSLIFVPSQPRYRFPVQHLVFKRRVALAYIGNPVSLFAAVVSYRSFRVNR